VHQAQKKDSCTSQDGIKVCRHNVRSFMGVCETVYRGWPDGNPGPVSRGVQAHPDTRARTTLRTRASYSISGRAPPVPSPETEPACSCAELLSTAGS
jgi:hypothetical protein